MRWKRSAGDGGVEDLRGSGGGLRGPAAIGGGLGGLGLVGVIIAIVVVFLGGGGGGFSPDAGLDGLGASPPAAGQGIDAQSPDADNTKAFVVFVVNDVQNSWRDQFARAGETYPPTTLRALLGPHPDRVRGRQRRVGAVLLPRRPAGVPGPRPSSASSASASARPATSPRPT